jgi:hypothetical protein
LFSYLNASDAEDGYDSTQMPGILSCDIAVANATVEILSIVPRRILEALQPGKNLISYVTSIAVSNNLAAMSSPNYPVCLLLSKAKNLLRVICPNETDDLEEAIKALRSVEAIVGASLDPWKAAQANKGFLENLLDSVLVLETIQSNSIDCIGRILSAILLCVRAVLPVASESENFMALISSLVERLFTNCGPLVRRSCVDFVNQAENSLIIEMISTVICSAKKYDLYNILIYISFSTKWYQHFCSLGFLTLHRRAGLKPCAYSRNYLRRSYATVTSA